MIRKIEQSDLELVKEHLLSLDSESRIFRFNCVTSDDYILKYIDKLYTKYNDFLFGKFENEYLQGVSHLVVSNTMFEFSVTVCNNHRKKGVASTLLTHSIDFAKQVDCDVMFIVCCARNKSVLKMVRKFDFEINQTGSEIEAVKKLKF